MSKHSVTMVFEDGRTVQIEAAETDTALLGGGRAFSRTLLTPQMREKIAQSASSTPGGTQSRSALRDAGIATTSVGQCVGLLRKIRSVKEIIDEMVS